MEQEELTVRSEPAVPFEVLIGDYRAAFERLARRMTRNTEDAEDLLQETLVDAYRSYPSFRSGTSFYSWVARIMMNNQLDRRRRKRHPVISLDHASADSESESLEFPDDTTNPERALFADQLDPNLVEALGQLQPHHRECVRLVDLEGATYEEAAANQDCPIGTIRSRLHRAHAAMQRLLGALVSGGSGREHEAPGRSSRRDLLRIGAIAAASATVVTFTPDDAEAEKRAPEHVTVCCIDQPPPDSSLRRALTFQDDGKPVLDVALFTAGRAANTASSPAPAATVETVFIAEGEALTREETTRLAHRIRTGEAGLVSVGNLNVVSAVLGEECAWRIPREPRESTVQALAPRHPLAEGVGPFVFPTTPRPSAAFVGPRPTVAALGGPALENGERGWAGMAWQVGRGRVFYLDAAPDPSLYSQENAARLLRNAARWVAWRTTI
jgi:RNA polymerase sigma-70 factor (ECF subfamily)